MRAWQLVVTQNGVEHDLSSQVTKPVRTWRGRKAYDAVSVAGTLNTTVYNSPTGGDRTYAAGGRWDAIQRGAAVELRLAAATEVTPQYNGVGPLYNGITPVYGGPILVWNGLLDEFELVTDSGYQEYRVKGIGLLASLTDRDISISAQTRTVGAAVTAIRAAHTAAGGTPPAIDVDTDVAAMTLTNWGVSNSTPLAALRDIEDETGAFLLEQRDARLRLQSATVREHPLPAARFTRETLPPFIDVERRDHDRVELVRPIVGGTEVQQRGFIDVNDVVEFAYQQFCSVVTPVYNGVTPLYNGYRLLYGDCRWVVDSVAYMFSSEAVMDQTLTIARAG